jgi:hypothetical protein
VLSSKRAVRYGLRVPVRYRGAGDERWREGLTLNVSASGVLIEGERPADSEPISVVIALPHSRGCLTGRGWIARVPPGTSASDDRTFAVAVPQFSLAHQDDAAASA